jgi:hypothetical protein
MTSLVSPPLYQAVLCAQQRNSSGGFHQKQQRIYKQQRKTLTGMDCPNTRCLMYAFSKILIPSSLVEDVDLQVMTFGDFGKSVLKEFNVSPDGFIQNAIQLAYYK